MGCEDDDYEADIVAMRAELQLYRDTLDDVLAWLETRIEEKVYVSEVIARFRRES
jgi:hypothetical protein